MKKITLLLLMTVCCMTSYADDFKPQPFVESFKEWKVWHFSPEYIDSPDAEYELPTEYVINFFGKEITIAGKIYTMLSNSLHYDIYLSEEDRAQLIDNYDKLTNGECLFREESGKVYKYDEDVQCEYLFYDFMLKEGDKFVLKVPSTGEEVSCTVSLVDEVTVQQSYNSKKNTYRRFHLVPDNENYEETVWIEGLGNECSPLISINRKKDKANGMFRVASAASRFYSYFYTQPINEKHFHGQELVNLYKEDNASSAEGLEFEIIGDTLHIHGQVNDLLGNIYLYCIDTSDGIIKLLREYIGTPTSGTGMINGIDAYFPGFQPGEYVLGQEGGPVIGVVPSGATDIDTTKQEKKLPRYIIDVSGMQLSRPKQGLNIINGKKVFIP